MTKKEKNFSEWYLETIMKADLIDYGPVKGTIIFKPYAYRLWEKLQAIVDAEIKKLGVQNLYFPIFIPESLLRREKEHFEGFAPEVAIVTYAGGEELQEKLVVRPTSETIMYPYFAKWVKSYRDLPLLINQWTNVIRWEKRPFPFLRNTEFLWHEGHTAHASHREALDFALKILAMYERIYQDVLGIYGFSGQKSENEKFAGALATYTYEILLPDGKALQGCTSHDLGQNFSKIFNIRFQDKDKKLKYVWQTSWAITTRALGAIVAVHGDDQGLVLPPKISPYQAVIIPIYNKINRKKIDEFAKEIQKEIPETYIDISEKNPGYKFNFWELKGVPLRIEIGAQEVKTKKLTVFRRDTKGRLSLTKEDFLNNFDKINQEIEKNLLERSKEFTLKNTFEANSYNEFKKIINTQRGFIKAFWCQRSECELKIKEETKATTRCLPLAKLSRKKGKCIYCRRPAKNQWLFALSY